MCGRLISSRTWQRSGRELNPRSLHHTLTTNCDAWPTVTFLASTNLQCSLTVEHVYCVGVAFPGPYSTAQWVVIKPISSNQTTEPQKNLQSRRREPTWMRWFVPSATSADCRELLPESQQHGMARWSCSCQHRCLQRYGTGSDCTDANWKKPRNNYII